MSDVLLLARNPQKAALFGSVLCCVPHQPADVQEEEEEDWSTSDDGDEDFGWDSLAQDEAPSSGEEAEVPDDTLIRDFNFSPNIVDLSFRRFDSNRAAQAAEDDGNEEGELKAICLCLLLYSTNVFLFPVRLAPAKPQSGQE